MNANERQCVIRFNSDPPTYYDGSLGDPGRTSIRARAKVYRNRESACRARAQLWRWHRRCMQIVDAGDDAP